MMISERHKTNNLVTILCCWLCLHVACPSNCLADEVFEVLPQTATTTKTANRQDEVNVLAFVTPNATTAPRLDPNNNNEWRPLGHGDPLQKDPTYDYSPPALDRVRYWAENNVSNQDARQKLPPEVLRNKTKSEILLLGVASERDRLRTAQVKVTSPYAQQQAKYAAIRRSYYAPQQQQQHQHQQLQQQQQHMPHTHLMPPPMMMKGMGLGHVEYRHSVMNSPSSSSYMSMNMGNSYSSSAASSSPSASVASSPSKAHYYSSPSTATSSWYSHSPSMTSLPHRLSYSDAHHQESMQHYSFSRPNSIHPHATGNKQNAPRKPWLHELLQKELVKPTMKQRMKPTMPATKYLMGTTKPQQTITMPTYAPLTYAPVTFVPGPPTIETPTTSSPIPEIYITPSSLLPTVTAGFRPMITSTTTTPVTTTTTTTRLMIPQQNNLSKRPTVAPAPELTTDALFSHYKQPPKPLLGPMYLIIEGHSKVKTYGQNELDPHSPKIVPVISKREPVVRIADPNEKRGTVETYQVKHLHTKTMPLTTTTTTTTTTTPATTRSTTTTTTMKPTTISSNNSSTTKDNTPPSGVEDLFSLLDNMFADAQEISKISSISSISSTEATKTSTILKPVTTKLMPQQPEPRISTKAGSIESLLEEPEVRKKDDKVKYSSEIATSTEPEQPPRATRQIFDYDQLPESRIKAENEEEEYDDEDQVELEEEGELLEDGELDVSEDETSDSEHNLLKRIDKFVDDVDDGDDDLDDLIEGLSPGTNDDNDDEEDDDDDDQQQAEEKQLH